MRCLSGLGFEYPLRLILCILHFVACSHRDRSLHSGRICSCDSRVQRRKVIIGSAIGGAVLCVFMAGMHFTYEWSVVDGQLHRGYYWTYVILACALVSV